MCIKPIDSGFLLMVSSLALTVILTFQNAFKSVFPCIYIFGFVLVSGMSSILFHCLVTLPCGAVQHWTPLSWLGCLCLSLVSSDFPCCLESILINGVFPEISPFLLEYLTGAGFFHKKQTNNKKKKTSFKKISSMSLLSSLFLKLSLFSSVKCWLFLFSKNNS